MSNVLGCICKDEVGSVTEVEGNTNLAKCVDILNNNRLPVVLKIISGFSKLTPVLTDKIVER